MDRLTVSGEKLHRSDVVVTDAWGRSAYNIVRTLARHDLSVVVGTDKFRGMAALSRYASGRFQHPFSAQDPVTFVASVKAALHRYAPRVYLPTSEDTYVVSRFLSEFQADGRTTIPVASFDTIRRLHKKDLAIALARSQGIPTPETIVPRGVDDVRAFARQYGSPIVLKQTSSSGARGVFYLTTEDLAGPAGERLPFGRAFSNNFIAQQYVDGTGYGVSMLFNRGRLRAKFTHKRLREKTSTGGISTVRVGVVNPILEEYAQRLLETVCFHGVAMVEFKQNEQTGQSWLLEVNPRFWGSLALAIQSGVDFPYLLYRMALDGDVDPVTTYQTGRVVRWILGDIGASVERLWRRRGEQSFRTSAAGYDDFYWDDPVPFLGGALLSMWKVLETRSWPAERLALNIEQLERS